MKPWSTITLSKPKYSPNNGYRTILRHQSGQKRFCPQERLCTTVFWDFHGLILIDYLENGKTICGEYYANLQHELSDKLEKKRPHLAKKNVLFHQNNAPAQSAIAMARIHQLHSKLVPQLPYSADMAPSHYHLFPNLKKWLGDKRFSYNSKVIAVVHSYVDSLDSSTYIQ